MPPNYYPVGMMPPVPTPKQIPLYPADICHWEDDGGAPAPADGSREHPFWCSMPGCVRSLSKDDIEAGDRICAVCWSVARDIATARHHYRRRACLGAVR